MFLLLVAISDMIWLNLPSWPGGMPMQPAVPSFVTSMCRKNSLRFLTTLGRICTRIGPHFAAVPPLAYLVPRLSASGSWNWPGLISYLPCGIGPFPASHSHSGSV